MWRNLDRGGGENAQGGAKFFFSRFARKLNTLSRKETVYHGKDQSITEKTVYQGKEQSIKERNSLSQKENVSMFQSGIFEFNNESRQVRCIQISL